MVYPAIDIAHLTVGERLGLIAQVWDSLRRDAGDRALSDTERALIESRRADHRVDPSSAVDWETVRTDLLTEQDEDDRRSTSSSRE